MLIEHKPKILVRRRAALGDVIMTTGVVRELHKKYNGQCEISVITEYTDVFLNNPYVNKVYHTSRPLVGMIWDVEYNLDNAYELNPTNHFIDSYYQRVFGTIDLNKAVEIYPAEHDKVKVNEILNSINGNFIVIHMRRWAWEHKNIKPEIWQEIINRILSLNNDIKIVIVGANADYNVQPNQRVLSLHGQLSIQQTKLLLENAVAFIGSDSAPYAIAGSTNVSVIPLLSHILPEQILPFRNNNDLNYKSYPIKSKIDCVGCYKDQVRPITQVVCKHGDFRCNGLHDINEVMEKVTTAIEEYNNANV